MYHLEYMFFPLNLTRSGAALFNFNLINVSLKQIHCVFLRFKNLIVLPCYILLPSFSLCSYGITVYLRMSNENSDLLAKFHHIVMLSLTYCMLSLTYCMLSLTYYMLSLTYCMLSLTYCCLCCAAKEIQLKHHAPVISISVIDRNAQPLPAPLEVQHERVKAPDMSGNHQVLLCSEEQFKVRVMFILRRFRPDSATAAPWVFWCHFVEFLSNSLSVIEYGY